jgi:dimethylamine monooxygenase subunit A
MTAEEYVPVERRGFRLTMGLRPLDLARWLEVDAARQRELAEKRRLLAEKHDGVVAVLPGSDPAAGDLLEAVLANLTEHHPDVAVAGDHASSAGDDGPVLDDAGRHPIELAGRIVQEDLCLLERRGGVWVLTAANVCFPSRWDLSSKLGQTLSGIHRPVPGYHEALAAPVEAYFDRLRPERSMWRLNWTLVDRPDLHLPDPSSRASGGAPLDPGQDLWFRVERQTLRRINDRPAITFTIRTYVTRLDRLCDAHPEVVEGLRASLLTAPPATVEYKGWGSLLGPVLTWLDERAETT